MAVLCRGMRAVDARVLAADAVELQLSVHDSGIGIPVAKQQGIFDAFTQADSSTTREFGGTGLGLTICARLVQLMGGRIWVESQAGQGSCFHFTVHVQALAAQRPAPPTPSAVLQPPVPASAQRLARLLVDDAHADVRRQCGFLPSA